VVVTELKFIGYSLFISVTLVVFLNSLFVLFFPFQIYFLASGLEECCSFPGSSGNTF